MSSFPTNPGVGDTTVVEDTVWRFNGTDWDRMKIGLGNRTRYARPRLEVGGDVTNVNQLPGPTVPDATRDGDYYFLVVDAVTGEIKVLQERFMAI